MSFSDSKHPTPLKPSPNVLVIARVYASYPVVAEENVLWSIAQSRLSSLLGVDIRCGGMHVRAHGLDKYLAKSCEHVWRIFRRQFVSNAE